MEKIILVFPPISASERYAHDVGETGGHLPPLGICSIAAVLEQKGFGVEIIDGPVSGMDVAELAEFIKKHNYSIVGISSLTATFYRAVELAKKIKSFDSKKPIVIGGHHATIMPKEIMKENKCFDVLVFGEGELTFLELAQKFKKNPKLFEQARELKKINGIFFREKGKVIQTNQREPIQNLDELPFPARHLLDNEKYVPLPNQYKRKPITNMVAIRGCPFQCTYCSNNAVFGRRLRFRSPESVVREIKQLKKDYGIKEISFWDDTLTVNREWLIKLCDLMVKEKLNVLWSCYGRVNTVDLELLKKMKKAGCWNIFYGLESGNQQLLDNIKKGITLEQIRQAIKWTKKAGIEARGSFMLFLPGETPEMARKTIDFAIDLDLDYAQFCITTPFPGTELYRTAEKWGTLKKEFNKFHIWAPVFIPFGYKSEEEVQKIYKESFRGFYFRPKYIIKRFLAMRSLEDIRRNLLGLRFVVGFLKGKSGKAQPE